MIVEHFFHYACRLSLCLSALKPTTVSSFQRRLSQDFSESTEEKRNGEPGTDSHMGSGDSVFFADSDIHLHRVFASLPCETGTTSILFIINSIWKCI